MTAAAKKVIQAALKLKPADRAQVARDLLDSLEGGTNGGLDAEWLRELERRARDIADGRTEFVSWPEARSQIERGLRRSR